MTFIRKKTVQAKLFYKLKRGNTPLYHEGYKISTKTTFICECDICGKEIERRQLHRGRTDNHYCSKKCYNESLITRKKCVCANPSCGKTYETFLSHNAQYCSHKCSIDAQYLGAICNHKGCKTPITKQNKSGYCEKHLKKYSYQKHKTILYKELGNKCVCCGERDLMFLSVDHVNNDGGKLRKEKGTWSTQIYSLLKAHRENPGSLQLLCSNCNHAKGRNGGKLYRPNKFTKRKLL